MAKKREFPPNTEFGSIFVATEKEDGKVFFRLKRMATLPNGKRVPTRLAKRLYKDVPNNYEAMIKHCDKLNYGLDLKKQRQLEIETAFIPPAIMTSFEALLRNEIPNQKDFRYLHSKVLKEYFLDFFIGRLKLPDPKEWIKRQSDWGSALAGKSLISSHNIFGQKVSAKTIKTTIQVANRFMKFLHLQMPNDYPAMEFKPFSKAAIKTYSAELESDGPIGKFITDADWVTIDAKLPSSISCYIRLMYFYGLRRAESMGFDSTDAVEEDSLIIRQQLKLFTHGKPTYAILKDKEQRLTPHWFCKPDDAFKWISQGLERKMHPDTLSARWDDLILGMGMDYKLHDLRRTFITKALRLHVPRDVQLAVGHANLATTMRYAQDDRQLTRKVWKPSAAS